MNKEFMEENLNIAVIDDKKIALEFKAGLLNAESNDQENSSGASDLGSDPKPRTGFLDKWFAEQFCHFKNNAIASRLSNDLDQTGKALVKEVYTATPEEIEEYLKLLEYGCVSVLPDSVLDNMEVIFKHPTMAVLKIEILKYRSLCKKLEAFKEKKVEMVIV